MGIKVHGLIKAFILIFSLVERGLGSVHLEFTHHKPITMKRSKSLEFLLGQVARSLRRHQTLGVHVELKPERGNLAFSASHVRLGIGDVDLIIPRVHPKQHFPGRDDLAHLQARVNLDNFPGYRGGHRQHRDRAYLAVSANQDRDILGLYAYHFDAKNRLNQVGLGGWLLHLTEDELDTETHCDKQHQKSRLSKWMELPDFLFRGRHAAITKGRPEVEGDRTTACPHCDHPTSQPLPYVPSLIRPEIQVGQKFTRIGPIVSISRTGIVAFRLEQQSRKSAVDTRNQGQAEGELTKI